MNGYNPLDLCASSYDPQGITGAVDIQVGSNRAFVLDNVVTFRGTQNPRNWLNDLDAKFTRYQGAYVHAGFLNYYLSLKPGILKSLKPNMPVYITGHSLGGAAALLAAMELPNVEGVCTFGAPRVGNRRFARLYRVLVKQTRCFVNQLDPVPWVPFALWGYRHAAPLTYFNGTEWEELDCFCYLKLLLKNWRSADDAVQYHFIKSYQEAFAWDRNSTPITI